MSTRTYYHGPDATVTDAVFVWRTSPQRGYPVHELRNVVRTGDAQAGPATVFVAGGSFVLIAAAWSVLGSPAGYVIGAAAVVAPVMFGFLSRRLRPRRFQLRATCRGTDILLYSTFDERVFNQVSRALLRSMEDSGSPAAGLGLAAA